MEKQYFKYTANGTDMAVLLIKNFIFSILTLGLYRPWARTHLRQFVWSHVQFQNDRGTYTGTGKELFMGWLKLMGFTILIVISAQIVFAVVGLILPQELTKGISGLAIACIYLYVFSIAIYSGFRYRMSRTQWRHINFGVERTKQLAKDFSAIYIGGIGLTFLTLGFYLPHFKNKTHKFLLDRARIGNLFFRYDGVGSEYFKIYWLNFFLCIVTLGIYTPWFIRNTLKYRLNKTHIDQAHFGIDLKGIDLLKFIVLSYIALILSFGIASPWIINWGYRLFVNKIYLEGSVDWAAVTQIAPEGNALGDEMVMDYELDFGF